MFYVAESTCTRIYKLISEPVANQAGHSSVFCFLPTLGHLICRSETDKIASLDQNGDGVWRVLPTWCVVQEHSGSLCDVQEDEERGWTGREGLSWMTSSTPRRATATLSEINQTICTTRYKIAKPHQRTPTILTTARTSVPLASVTKTTFPERYKTVTLLT